MLNCFQLSSKIVVITGIGLDIRAEYTLKARNATIETVKSKATLLS